MTHRRMLGNGYCARPVEDDAAAWGQVGRQKTFDGLLSRLQEDAL